MRLGRLRENRHAGWEVVAFCPCAISCRRKFLALPETMDGVPAFVRLGCSNPHDDRERRVAPVLTALRFVLLPALSRLHSWSCPSVSCYFRAFSGSACPQMIVCGRNLLQKVRKSLLFSRGCITFAHGSSKKRDVWTSFRLFRFEIPSGEMVEWSITAVLKTAVPRGTGGSNPSLSANRL